MAPYIKLLGKKFIVDLRVKRMVRVAPKANARARCIGAAARGQSLDKRKAVFADAKCKIKGK